MSHQIKHNVTLGYEIIDDLYRFIQKLKKKIKFLNKKNLRMVK